MNANARIHRRLRWSHQLGRFAVHPPEERNSKPVRKNYEEALAMNDRLYPQNEFPRGHPNLPISLMNLGGLHWPEAT